MFFYVCFSHISTLSPQTFSHSTQPGLPRTQYLAVRRDDKAAFLVWMLRNVIAPEKQTVIFCATKHHVEYLKELLTRCEFEVAHCYGNLDMTARKIEIAKFRHGKAKLLIVTDVAARGIDIPMLDYVVNFDFPAKPKVRLFSLVCRCVWVALGSWFYFILIIILVVLFYFMVKKHP